MSVDRRWLELRADQSKSDSFESLCCQLAASEPPGTGGEFVRVKAPDAGVECYWALSDGTEHGWQAKFFPSRLTASEWRQLDESVDTALRKRPRLRRYTICLPRDLEEPKLPRKRSARDAWRAHVIKWRRWAAARDMRVEFRLWDNSALWIRLTEERHAGRRQYWFRHAYLSGEWFERRRRESIRLAGPRYTAECNVRLPVARVFDGLGRTRAFTRRLAELLGALHRPSQRALRDMVREPTLGEYSTPVSRALSLSATEVESVDVGTTLPIHEIRGELGSLFDTIEHAWLAALELDRQRRAATPGPEHHSAFLAHQLGELRRALSALSEFLSSPEAVASERRVLLLVGDAGVGKTHLLCDIATLRLAEGAPTVLLLGEQIASASPGSAILQQLDLEKDVTFDGLLAALDARAEALGQRALILIDALNESTPRTLWIAGLPVLLERVLRHPRLALALSVRTTYADVTLPELPEATFVRVEHRGFAGSEDEAVPLIFRANGLREPVTPILQPEFSNPLFLKLMCKWLRASGRNELPKGHVGLVAIFQSYVEYVDKRLSQEKELDFDRRDRIVDGALEAFSNELVKAKRNWIPREVAVRVTDAILPGRRRSLSLFTALVREGLLGEDRYRTDDGQFIEGVRFTYERLGDHIVASALAQGSSAPQWYEKRSRRTGVGRIHPDSRYRIRSRRGVRVLGPGAARGIRCRAVRGRDRALDGLRCAASDCLGSGLAIRRVFRR